MRNRSIATSLVRKCRSIRLYKRRRSRVMAAPSSNGAGQEFMIAAPNDSHRYLKKQKQRMTYITSVERFLTRARSSAPTRLVMLPSAKMADPIALIRKICDGHHRIRKICDVHHRIRKICDGHHRQRLNKLL